MRRVLEGVVMAVLLLALLAIALFLMGGGTVGQSLKGVGLLWAIA